MTTQIRSNPAAVSDLPQALSYLVTTETVLSDAPEVGAAVIVMSASL